jgi:hypothetical protein
MVGFATFYWLGLATYDKDYEAPSYLCKIRISADRIMSTDSKRLHVVNETFGFEQGIYCIDKFTKREIVVREDTSGFGYPDAGKLLSHAPIESKHTGWIGGDIDVAFATLIRILPEHLCLQFIFFADLMYEAPNGYQYFVDPEDFKKEKPEGHAVYFKSDLGREALIMPKLVR